MFNLYENLFQMKVIIFGASGMIGKGVLLECLDSAAVEQVLAVGRSSTGVTHVKLRELIHKDFTDFVPVAEMLTGYDACYFCLGVSAAGMSEGDYKRITYDYTMAAARVLRDRNPGMTFCYVSGAGTDSTEKGRMMWARVKGKTENDLLRLGFRQTFLFRPGAIRAKRGIKSRTPLYRIIYRYFGWILAVIELLAPGSITDTIRIGRAMINASLHGYHKTIIDPKDINRLAAGT